MDLRKAEESRSEAEIRLEKLAILREKGVNPYPSDIKKEQSISEAKKLKTASIVGKIVSIRSHGKSTFMDIQDDTDIMQIYFKFDEVGEKQYENLKNLDTGDYLFAKGDVFTTKSGEITIAAKAYKLVAKSLLPLPDKWSGFKDTEARYRKRYLDMIINPDVKKNLETRSKLVSSLRRFMEENGFIEVETPILQSIPGGAAAKPFITHYNILKQDMFLRIAPELYLKRLVVGGFEKVFEIGKNFRNEGVSHMHNPEFSAMEFYWAYQDYKSLMKFTESLLKKVVKEVNGSLKVKYQDEIIDFTPPYPVITFDELIKKDSGIDIYQFSNFGELKKEVQKKGIELNFKEIKVWAKLVDELYKKVSRPKILQPIFVIDQPLVLTPLAKAKEDDPRKAQRFQLVLANGTELLNAYTELNDPIEQDVRFNEQVAMSKAGWDESSMKDDNFVDALKYGLPPTAGWGMGIERMTMILADQYSIKEVIAFPTLKTLSEETDK